MRGKCVGGLVAAMFLLAGMVLRPASALSDPEEAGPGPAPEAQAGPPGGPGGPAWMHRGEPLMRAIEKLGVNEETKAKIKDLAYAANKELIAVRAEMESAALDMRKLMDEDTPDEGKIMKQIDKIGSIEVKLRKNRVGLLLSVRKLLTPEQRVKLRDMVEQWEERHAPMGRGPMRGAPGGPTGK